MAFTALNHVAFGSTDGNSVSINRDSTGADLIVLVLGQDVGTLCTISDSLGNTWNQLTQRTDSPSTGVIFWCRPTSVGAGHTFTATGSGVNPAIAVGIFSGSHPTPFDQENGAGGGAGATIATGSVTPSTNDQLIIAGASGRSGSGTINSITGGFTLWDAVTPDANNDSVALAYLIQTTATAANPTWTFQNAGGVKVAMIATFKAGHFKVLSGGLTPTGVAVKRTYKNPTGSISPSGVSVRAMARALAGALSPVGVLAKRMFESLSGAVTPTGVVTNFKVTLISLAGSVTPTGAIISRTINKVLSATVTPVGSIVRHISRLLAGLLTPTGTLATRVIGESSVQVSIASVDRTTFIRHGSLEVEDVLNDAPNRCTFTCTGFVPAEGSVVQITRGPTGVVEFAGHVVSVQQFYESILANTAYFVTCTDYIWKLDRRLITKRWVNVSASTIAQEIISGFTTGFTSTHVVGGLAVIPEFEAEEEDPSRVLSRLAAEVGGNWYVDYDLDLHFFITEATDTPEDISDATLATTTARGLAHLGDLSQIRTRVRGTGAGSSLLANIIHSAVASLPLDTAAMFHPVSGQFRSSKGPNIGVYAGKHDGGLTAKVAGSMTSGAAPTGSPSVAVAPNVVGVLQGVYRYKVAFANENGETIPGPESGSVTGVAFTPPGAGTVNASGTLGVLIGAYNYKVTFVTALGETTGGTTFGRTATVATIPNTPTTANTLSVGILQGAYNYRVTFVGPDGIESESSSSSAISPAAMTGPSAPSVDTTAANCKNGPLKPGQNYKYKVSFVGSEGRESLGTATGDVTPSATVADDPSISGDGTGNSIKIRVAWRSPYGESAWSNAVVDTNHGADVTVTPTGFPADADEWVIFSTGSYVSPANPTTYYRMPVINQGSGAAILSTNGVVVAQAASTMGKKANLSSVAIGATGTLARRIYRTKAGGSTYYLVGEIGDNSTTTFTDATPDDSLTVLAPVENLNGQQISITNIQTGPAGTVKRRLYRTKAGGSTFGLLAEIQDNTTTSYVDNIPDDSLNMGISIPAFVGERHAGQQHALTSIPTGPTGTVARRIYRTEAGGTSYQFLAELTDNTTTSYTDNTPDGSLGHYVPLVNTAGANKIAVSSIPLGGAGITKRILYRTEAGGSVYKYVATINDNSTTTYTDNTPDTSLGREAQIVNTIGVVPGDTSLLLTSVVGWPTAGWLKAGNQLIRWTGISGSALTGIPGARATTITRSGTTATATTTGAHGFTTGEVVTIQGAVQSEYNGEQTVTVTGATTFTYTVAGTPATPATGTIAVYAVGAITSNIAGGTGVVTAAFLSGVTGLVNPMEKGAPVRIYVVQNDTAAQTALAVLEGGDGIHEAPLDDSSLMSVAALTAACDAELQAWSTKLRTVTFKSRHPMLRTGKSVTLNLGPPVNQSGTFLIQRVISTEFDIAPGLNPLRDVIAAPVRVSFQDVIRRERNKAA